MGEKVIVATAARQTQPDHTAPERSLGMLQLRGEKMVGRERFERSTIALKDLIAQQTTATDSNKINHLQGIVTVN